MTIRYFATSSGPKVCAAIDAGLLGQIATPVAGNRVEPGRHWCADNGVFGGKYPGDDKYLAWLSKWSHLADTCQFAAAPDVIGRGPNGELVPDAAATLERSAPMLPRIRALGYRAALVAQNGLEHLDIPWDTFDALFIGGDDAWKLGPAVRALVAEAKTRGKWVHMGRVNSWKRITYAQAIGCDSVDGTGLGRAPDLLLPRLLHWLKTLDGNPYAVHRHAPYRALHENEGQQTLWEVTQ